jgi:hypothetical protein
MKNELAIEVLQGQIKFKKDQLEIYMADVKDKAVKERIKVAFESEIEELNRSIKILKEYDQVLEFSNQ